MSSFQKGSYTTNYLLSCGLPDHYHQLTTKLNNHNLDATMNKTNIVILDNKLSPHINRAAAKALAINSPKYIIAAQSNSLSYISTWQWII